MTNPQSTTTVRTRDGRATRDAIVAAASRLMHVHGYQQTSLDDVLRESGVGKGNFYYHFKSKEELGHAILGEVIRAFLERTLEPCFTGNQDRPLEQVRCLLDRVVEIQRRSNCVGGCALGNLAAELSDVHEGFRTRLAEVFSAWQDRLTLALREAQMLGHVGRDCEPTRAARFLVASLEGAILMTKLTKDITVLEQCVGEMKRYLGTFEPGGRR